LDLTMGGMMFFGGLAGLGLTALCAMIVSIARARGKRNIEVKLNSEYGSRVK